MKWPSQYYLTKQLIRVLFELFPYQFLSLNSDVFAYPLAASVPVIAGSLQIYTYLDQGTLCTKGLAVNLHYKLDMCIDVDKVFFTDTRTDRNGLLQ